MLRKLACPLIVMAPWPLKRTLLQLVFGYRIHPSARIGLAWFFPKTLVMERGARVHHLVTAVHLDEIRMGEDSSIARGTWITGFPSGDPKARHFAHLPGRISRLVLGVHSAITKDHHIDCTAEIRIGDFTTVAGYRSQLLTHSIDLAASRQDAKPIQIGNHCFVGTACVVLGGSVLPDRSVLGALSLLNKEFTEPETLYAGQPARPVRTLDPAMVYFHRSRGFVD